ncbi:4636_t:CDS:2 [Paraglomus brasilianum]|uniref:4636_t:CDS:1 n=1 Tax=Paraglomus brasilianum TaxID=144538 RepID=A0A9N9FAX5_9GLOM|nr:4636_t:CDS:2 [Paraglomus brasilianum]
MDLLTCVELKATCKLYEKTYIPKPICEDNGRLRPQLTDASNTSQFVDPQSFAGQKPIRQAGEECGSFVKLCLCVSSHMREKRTEIACTGSIWKLISETSRVSSIQNDTRENQSRAVIPIRTKYPPKLSFLNKNLKTNNQFTWNLMEYWTWKTALRPRKPSNEEMQQATMPSYPNASLAVVCVQN